MWGSPLDTLSKVQEDTPHLPKAQIHPASPHGSTRLHLAGAHPSVLRRDPAVHGTDRGAPALQEREGPTAGTTTAARGEGLARQARWKAGGGQAPEASSPPAQLGLCEVLWLGWFCLASVGLRPPPIPTPILHPGAFSVNSKGSQSSSFSSGA